MSFIPEPVSQDLLGPVVTIGLWRTRAPRAIVTVPKTTVNENHLPPCDKGQIGRAGQVFAMQPVMITEVGHQAPDREFRSCIFAANRLHRTPPHGDILFRERISALPDWFGSHRTLRNRQTLRRSRSLAQPIGSPRALHTDDLPTTLAVWLEPT